jgi:hypothetical protein
VNRCPVAVALIHHPVLDRRGETVAAAVTNLDLHDIARIAHTYGANRFYVVTPVAEQRTLVQRILSHWCKGFGASYNPHRGEALVLVETVATLEDALGCWENVVGKCPLTILTGAARRDGVSFAQCRALLQEHPLLLVFGTGWGLAPQLFERGWTVLAPVTGSGGYNHLPVRAAAAIILDRLLGNEEKQSYR